MIKKIYVTNNKIHIFSNKIFKFTYVEIIFLCLVPTFMEYNKFTFSPPCIFFSISLLNIKNVINMFVVGLFSKLMDYIVIDIVRMDRLYTLYEYDMLHPYKIKNSIMFLNIFKQTSKIKRTTVKVHQ